MCLYFLFSSLNFLIFSHFFCNFSLIFNVTLYGLHILSSLWFFTIISSILPFLLLFTSLFQFPLFPCSYNHVLRSLQKQQLSCSSWSQCCLMDKESQNILQLRGQAWHQPSCIWLSSDLNLLSNVETTGTWDLLYQIFWLLLNLLFIKENKIEVLMSIDENNKDEPQLSHNGLHTHKIFVASMLSYGG